MINELSNLILVEKYRPTTLDDFIFNEKSKIKDYLKNPKLLPSFIFYSNKPGTGKTTLAKIIINTLNCDSHIINSSKDRGIDIIRQEVSIFARGMGMNEGSKKCVFLDESDGLTKQAFESLKNLMETYSDNCFFIFSCNDYSKIIEPIKSRCISFNFNKPDKKEIFKKLQTINKQEKVGLNDEEIQKTVDLLYPDIRSMIMSLQDRKMGGGLNDKIKLFNEALSKLKSKDLEYFKQKIFSQELELCIFNNFLFDYFFNNFKILGLEKTGKILLLLADNEKSLNLGNNLEIIFTSNLIQIMNIL